jgi:chemotaxis protein MotA
LEDELEEILNDRIVTKQREEEKVIGMIRVLAKFPPALGLLATVLSLITLLDGLGGDSLGVNSLGPAMAVGLVGTLYGIVLANLVFAPIAENLHAKTMLEVQNRRIALVGLSLIAQKKNPLLVQEMVNSQLSPRERVDVLGINERGAA